MPDELIEHAIKEGFKTFGVSEHAFIPNKNNFYSIGSKYLQDEYLDVMNTLKEYYKDKINVLVGLEIEVFHSETGELLIDYINELSSDKRLDYIIIGHHAFNNKTYASVSSGTPEVYEGYVKGLEEVFKSCKIACLAHPDVFVNGNGSWNEQMEKVSKQIIDLSIKHDVPLGLNINGLVAGVKYPSPEFWDLVSKTPAKAILELDTHSIDRFDQESINKGYEFAKAHNVKLIEKLDI